MPWVTALDARLGVNYRLGKDSVITLSVEGFNVFNSQRPIAVDNNYTFDTVGPVINATQGTVPKQYGGTCTSADPATCAPGNGHLPKPFYANGAPAFVSLPDPNQQPIGASVNPNWGRPLYYQPVRTFRFGARFTF
jgi:hypothetical protein